MFRVTATLFEDLVLADQTALVRRLLSQSKDIGTDKVFNEEHHDQAYRYMKRHRFRWFRLTGADLSEMKASANFRRQASLNTAGLEDKSERMQRLVDDLDMAELVGGETVEPEYWLLIIDSQISKHFIFALEYARIPIIKTEYGTWMADDKVLANNFLEAERVLKTPEIMHQCRM